MLRYIDARIVEKLIVPLIAWHEKSTGDSRFILAVAFFNLAALSIGVSVLLLMNSNVLPFLLIVIVGTGYGAFLWWPGRRIISSLRYYDVETKRGVPLWMKPYPNDHIYRLSFIFGALSLLLLILVTFSTRVYVALAILPAVFGFWSFVIG